MAGMKRQVYLENWQPQLVATITDIEQRLGPYTSPEQTALLGEIEQLNELARQVREVPPGDRQVIKSVVLPLYEKAPLPLSDDLMLRLAEIFDIYRRFRTKLVWNG
jgi:hypothetical protein